MSRLDQPSPHIVTQRDKQKATRYFNAISSYYDEFSGAGPLRYLRAKEHASVLRLANFGPPASTMLDVGCGAGYYAFCAKAVGMHVCAIDICHGMVERVRPFVDEAYVGDVEELSLGRQFDIVIAAGVLDFVSDPKLSLANLAALVAPEGRLVIQVPTAGWASTFYRIEKRVLGFNVNVFNEDWFIRESRHVALKLSVLERPLPFNFTLLFRKP